MFFLFLIPNTPKSNRYTHNHVHIYAFHVPQSITHTNIKSTHFHRSPTFIAKRYTIGFTDLNAIYSALHICGHSCRIQLSITREVTRYMEPGHWFVSLYNDDGDAQEVTFYAAIAEDMTQNCPNGCSGNGQCLLGHCQCNPGFGGDDCSESVCPVLCSQHGEYINGECICNPGWKGKECSLRHDECEVADCNGHGHCVSGKCQCMRGYKGKFCEEGNERVLFHNFLSRSKVLRHQIININEFSYKLFTNFMYFSLFYS